MHRTRSAFTLVELSIVLVILGLLVGGVLAGQSLIRASELRAVTTEYRNYQTALGAFKDKYFALPGDMNNAVKFWGAQAGTAADGIDTTCRDLDYTSPATGLPTCNGDGNGEIGNALTLPHELWRAWHHLANAGLVEGSFIGVSAVPAPYEAAIGSSVPRSKLNGAGWTLVRRTASDAYSAFSFDVPYGNALEFGARRAASTTIGAVIVAEEAFNIDTKLDDGLPQSGKVLSYRSSNYPDCVTGTDDAYLLTSTVKGCALIFITGY